MFVDIFSLGQGQVNATAPGGVVFGLNNLQVLHGYRFEAIPEEVLRVACGPYGKWDGEGTPLLEIVDFHGAPVMWPQLPPEHRTLAIQGAGVAYKVPLNGKMPEKRKPLPPRPVPETVSAEIRSKLTNPTIPLPNPIAEAGGASVLPSTDVPKTTIRPSFVDGGLRPLIEDLTNAPASISPRPVVEMEDEEEEDEEALPKPLEIEKEDKATCAGTTASGSSCGRSPMAGQPYCYAHRGR